MIKKELLIPEPELIIVGQHPYSLQAIGKKLPVWKATNYAEAMDRVSASESGEPMRDQAYHIAVANKIAKYGRGLLVIGVFDNHTADPGNPESLRGHVYAGLERVKEYGVGVNGGRLPTFTEELPSIFSGPVVAKEYKPDPKKDLTERISNEDRFLLKMHLVRFAINALKVEETDEESSNFHSHERPGLRVSTKNQDLEGKQVFATLQAKDQDYISAVKGSDKQWKAGRAQVLPTPNQLDDIFAKLI